MSNDELKRIIVSARSVRQHTEKEISDLVRWVELTRLNNMLVDMVLNGLMHVEWTPENEPLFYQANG